MTGNNLQSLGALWVAVASVVGLVSWMDMLMMTVVCHRAAGWAQLIMLRLSLLNSTVGARQCRARIIESCTKTSKNRFLLPSFTLLYIDTPSELGHQLTHNTRDTGHTTISFIGLSNGPKATAKPQLWCAYNKAITMQNGMAWNFTIIMTITI